MSKHTSFRLIAAVVVGVAAMVAVNPCTHVQAALVPSYTVTAVNSGTQIQVTVFGADPNAAVMLYYPSTGSMGTANLGQTNQSGYLNVTLSPTVYPVASGASTYVLVDGAQSQIAQWPSYSTAAPAAYISLSQSSVSIQAGQGTAVSVTGSNTNIGALSVSSNSNPSAVSATVSGNQIVINGLSGGGATLNICASNSGCATLTVNVSQSQASPTTQPMQSAISFDRTSVSTTVGQTATVNMSGPGAYYVSSNSNSGIVSTSITGSTLSITGRASGTSVLGVCSAGNNSTSCSNVNVTVNPSSSGTIDTSSSTVVFTQSNVTLSSGQKVTVGLSSIPAVSSPTYYVSTNSNPSSVTVNVNGSNADVIGVAFGGANISICQVGGGCGNLYAYVTPSDTGGTAPAPAASSVPLALTSMTISSNNVGGGFTSRGAAVSVSFNFNQPVSHPTVSFAGSATAVYGSGSGPYTSVYTLTGNESISLKISISAADQAGNQKALALSVGNPTDVSSGASAIAGSSAVASAEDAFVSFTRYLYMGMTAQGRSDPDVLALQKRLSADGFFNGPLSGYFGPVTKSAVKAYQRANGLDPVGVVGPSTRALLNKGK
ncbi:peptidoglycan-binding protein [Patescibacteria group bacterium]|nr:peptidoglycan-binding protein [Patescibacteria group bacterium]